MTTNGVDEKNIVVLAIDHSSYAKETVDYYIKKIHKPGNKLILTCVIEMPENAMQAMHSMMSRDKIQELWRTEEERAEELEADYVEQLKAKGVHHISIRNEGGMKPGHVICHVAEEEKASLIVIGSRGAGKIRRTILGSVSDYVVNHAHCPVLVCNYGKERFRHLSEKDKQAEKERQRHGSGGGKERERHPSGRDRLRQLSGKNNPDAKPLAPLKLSGSG